MNSLSKTETLSLSNDGRRLMELFRRAAQLRTLVKKTVSVREEITRELAPDTLSLLDRLTSELEIYPQNPSNLLPAKQLARIGQATVMAEAAESRRQEARSDISRFLAEKAGQIVTVRSLDSSGEPISLYQPTRLYHSLRQTDSAAYISAAIAHPDRISYPNQSSPQTERLWLVQEPATLGGRTLFAGITPFTSDGREQLVTVRFD